MRSHHCGGGGHRDGVSIHSTIRSEQHEGSYDEEETLARPLKTRGKRRTFANDFTDWNLPRHAVRSSGWKSNKCRHKWDHRLREQEKHQRNQKRKGPRRGNG